MAYVRNFNPLDDQTETTGQQQGMAQNPVITTTSTDIATNPNTAVNPNAQKQGAGGFTNLQRYLSANQGGANVLGGKVSGLLDTSRQNAVTGMDTAGTQFTGEVAKNTNIFNSNLADQAARDASAYLSNEDLAKQLSGTYTGPTNYAGSEQDIAAQKTLREAREKQLLADNVGGRTQLIRDVVNTPGTRQTTQGGLNLNQFLVQNTAPVYNKIKSSADSIEPLAQTYFDKATGLQEGVQAAQKTNQATREAALARLGQGTTDLQKQITDMMTQRQAQLDAAARDRVYGSLAEAGATPEQIAAYQTADAAARQYGGAGVDFRNYVTREVADRLGTKDVADAAQAEDLAALAKLTGGTDNFLQAGTKGTGPRLDLTSMLGQLQGQQTEGMYRKNLADQQAAYAAAQAAQQAALDKANADAKAQQEAALKAQQEQQAAIMAEMQKLIDAQKGIGTTPTTPAPTTPRYDGENSAPPLPRARPDPVIGDALGPIYAPGYGPGEPNYWESTGGDSTGGSTSSGSTVGGMSNVGPDGVAVGVSTGISNTAAAAIGNAVAGVVGMAVAVGINSAVNAMGQADADAVNAAAMDGPAPGVAPSAAANAAPSGVVGLSPEGQAAVEGMIGQDAANSAAAAAAAEGDAAASGDSGDSGSAASADGDGGASSADGDGGASSADGDGGAGAAGDGGGGGGGGGGGKIICTAMNDLYGLPYTENKIWTKYSITHLKPEHQRGYHKVFLPLVDYAYKQGNGWSNRKVRAVLEWIAHTRTQGIKDELEGKNPRPVLRVVRKTIEKMIYFIGKGVRNDKK